MVSGRSTKTAMYGLAILAAGIFAGTAVAEPSAIVEDIETEGASLGFMDYVEPGEVVNLGSDGRLILGYFAGCVQETITGGKVTVGKTGSTVEGGSIETLKVDCDSGQVELTDRQSNSSGVVAFRGGGSAAPKQAKPQLTLHGLSPIVQIGSPGTLTITRIDSAAPPIEMIVTAGAVDLYKRQIVLAAGAIYRAELTAAQSVSSVVFETDAFAEAGALPAVSRLLRL